MDKKARAAVLELAQELDTELGGGVTAALLNENKTRDFGQAVSAAPALVGLIMGAVQIVMQLRSDKKMANLQAFLEEHLPKPDNVSSEQRASIICKVLSKLGDDSEKTS